MRRIALAALSAALILSGCSDQTTDSPTEPAVPAPEQNFGSTCTVVPFPLQDVNSQINDVFPNGRLRFEALARAGAIKLFWDTCHPDAARRIAVAFIQWMEENFDRGKLRGATEEEVQELTITILNGVGVAVTAPTATGDFGVGIYDGEKTVIKTASEVALVEIEADAFADGQPRLIVVRRWGDGSTLHSFSGDQFPPYFDYDATKLDGPTLPADKVLDDDKFAIIAFCMLAETEDLVYPDNPRIGHNPVAGAGLPAFEILDPVALVAGADGEPRLDLASELVCGSNLAPNPGDADDGGGVILLSGGGMPYLANAAAAMFNNILVPVARSVLLPQPLSATAVVGFGGPLGGKTTSLSPFGVVGAPDDVLINFDVAPNGSTVANGTVVNTLYTPQGVTFQHFGGASLCGTDVRANSNQPEGFGSSPNVVSFCEPSTASDISENTFGLIQADFVSPAFRVCIDVAPAGDETHFARLDAFDAAGAPLGSVSSTPGVTETLCFAGTGIRRVRFSGAGTKFARFDNLQVRFTALAPVE